MKQPAKNLAEITKSVFQRSVQLIGFNSVVIALPEGITTIAFQSSIEFSNVVITYLRITTIIAKFNCVKSGGKYTEIFHALPDNQGSA